VLLSRSDTRPLLLVNRARDDAQAEEVSERILGVCDRFIGRTPRPIGWLPEDPLVGECVNRRGTTVALEPHASFSGALRQHAVVVLEELRAIHARGLEFMPPPPPMYYKMSKKRVHDHQEPLDKLQKHGILIDGIPGPEGRRLLQIFTATVIGPIFFEIIQRKGNKGFGEGNFTALFESIELDQVRRGVL